MKKIKGVKLTDDLLSFVGNNDVASNEGFPVDSFKELQIQMAKLACLNERYILYYRGQKHDYKADDSPSHRSSSFYPTIYRGTLSSSERVTRWTKLEYASKRLVDYLKEARITSSSLTLLERKKLLQWSILQHYEVVATPLIDVTQSLRVACSFALLDNPIENGDNRAYVYAFGLPYVNHRISIDSEEYLTNIRLLNIAPPEALRPYHQEGFLIGEDFIQRDYFVKEELDLNNRLIAKFTIPKDESFWDIESEMKKDILYPKDDLVGDICEKIKEEIDLIFKPGGKHDISDFISTADYVSFISHWIEIEKLLRETYSRKMGTSSDKTNLINVRTIIDKLDLSNNDSLRKRLIKTNHVRNIIFHDPDKFSPYMADVMKSVIDLEFDLKKELLW